MTPKPASGDESVDYETENISKKSPLEEIDSLRSGQAESPDDKLQTTENHGKIENASKLLRLNELDKFSKTEIEEELQESCKSEHIRKLKDSKISANTGEIKDAQKLEADMSGVRDGKPLNEVQPVPAGQQPNCAVEILVTNDNVKNVDADTAHGGQSKRIYPNLPGMKEGDGEGSKIQGGMDIPMTEIPNSSHGPPQHGHHKQRHASCDSDTKCALPQRAPLRVKIGGSDEDLEDRAEPRVEVLPPDGGWGWMVVAASFMCNVMVDGIIFTCGMLQPYIKEDFNVSNSQVSWVASLLGGFYLLVGPFVSSLASSYGFRTVCIIGSIVGAIACGISYFASSIFYLYVSYGILAGIGFGFIYVPAVISTGFYFEKKRALATGIAVCGSGIGTFILAPVNKYLLGAMGWRGALLVYAGLILTCIIYSLAFRPLSAATGRVVAVDEEYPGGIPLLQRIKATRDKQFQECLSTVSLPPDSASGQLPPGPDSLLRLQHPQVTRLREDETGKPIGRSSLSAARLSVSSGHRGSLRSVHSKHLFRDDAFYSGSMARLPQYNSSESMGHYQASVTRMPPAEEEQTEETKACCNSCPTATRAFLVKTFDFSLCTSPTFLVLSFSGFLSLLSLFVPFNFLPTFLTETQDEFGFKNDDEAEQAKAFLMSLIGICNTIGRVICGYISDRPKVDAIMVNNLALVIGGIATILLPFIRNVSVLYAYGIVFGLSIAVFASLRSILLVELLGLEKLTSSFGLLLLIQGFAACLGSPIAGSFADYTGNFAVSFYVFGATYAISGVMCIPIRKIKLWEDKRAEAKKQDNNL